MILIRRALLAKGHHAERTTVEDVEAAVLVKSLVAAAAALLEDAHGYEDADGGRRTAVLLVLTFLCEQGTEHILVYVAGHFTEELVVPRRRVVVFTALTLTHQAGRAVEQAELLVCTAFLEHCRMTWFQV